MPQRFEVLDSWRGICAVLVVAYHIGFAGHLYDVPVIRHGSYGVAFFFVLSGFVIAHTSYDRLSSGGYLREFMIRRFARIYPLHLATLLAMVALELVKLALSHGVESGQSPFTGAASVPALGANLVLAHGLGFFHEFTWNAPSWSISTEFYVYLAFALVLICAKARFAVAASMIVLVAASWMAVNDLSPSPVHVSGGAGLVSCILGFFSGALTYRLFRRFGPAPPVLEPFALAGVLAVFWFGMWGGLEVFVFALFVYVFASEGGMLSKVFRSPPLLVGGAASYSIYLLHYPVITTINSAARLLEAKGRVQLFVPHANGTQLLLLGAPWLMDLAEVLLIIAIIAVAWLCYLRFERPAEQWVRSKLLSPARARAAPQTEPAAP